MASSVYSHITLHMFELREISVLVSRISSDGEAAALLAEFARRGGFEHSGMRQASRNQ